MRLVRLAGAILLALALTQSNAPVLADADLTALVNAAYFPRTESAQLHDIAHQRAVEISSDFSHNGMRPGVAEVIAYNSGFPDPIAHLISQWQGSPPHDAILNDRNLTLIGCGTYFDGVTTWAACVLSASDTRPSSGPPNVTNPPIPITTPAPLLPNTATEEP